MASVTARLSVLGENGYGEPEQDANSALTELDKGLRSGKIGDQCEAIVRFPRLFAKYPFPILINSAFLKLADVFRLGTNFLRLCVLKVTQQSVKHLDKILNVDEFVRRIYSVIHSNDPLARALTLRTLGSIAYIIADRRNVHHTIRVSLDSHDAVELEAAIFATEKFSSCSKTFASNICEKVSHMIEGLATPVEMKLKLIPIFQFMHHDAQTAAMVRKLCTDLLPMYPAQQFVLVTLNTLTQLASASTIDVPDQVSLLIQYLISDPRHPVKCLALRNLRFLAEVGAHMWTEFDIKDVFNFAVDTQYKELKCSSLGVLIMLAKTVAVGKFDIFAGSPFQRLCLESCYSDDAKVAAKSVELLTQVALYTYREGHTEDEFDLFQEAVLAIESLLLFITSGGNDSTLRAPLKVCLLCAVRLCEADSAICHQFVDSIGSLVTTTTGPTTVMLCEALAAMANCKAHILSSLATDLLASLRRATEASGRAQDTHLIVMLSTMAFQAAKDQTSLCSEVETAVNIAAETIDPWACYKIARQAARYGHHTIAARLFASLTNCVSSEHLHFWLVGLWEVFAGESCLVTTTSTLTHVDRLMEAVAHYMRGISALKSATTQSHTLQFQCEYARLRAEMLQVHAQLIDSCCSHKTAPPPAIAAAVATATRDELSKCGRIAVQLRKSVKDFRTVGEQYGKLCHAYFDMDPVTLTNILVLQQSCNLVAYAIENIAIRSQSAGLVGQDEDGAVLDVTLMGSTKQQQVDGIEIRGMLQASRRAHAIAHEIISQPDLKPIGYEVRVDRECKPIGGPTIFDPRHIQAILDISRTVTEVPLCYPRFFFQSLQSTVIKLAISPQPRSIGEPINVQSSSHLALKVEGIVQHGAGQGRFRSVKSVVISVSSQLQQRQQPLDGAKGYVSEMSSNSSNNMTQTVPPHNDYFNAQFLLAFPVAGLHSVVIELAVLDENGELWKTGPRSVTTTKSCDDSSGQKSGTGSASSSSRSSFPVRY